MTPKSSRKDAGRRALNCVRREVIVLTPLEAYGQHALRGATEPRYPHPSRVRTKVTWKHYCITLARLRCSVLANPQPDAVAQGYICAVGVGQSLYSARSIAASVEPADTVSTFSAAVNLTLWRHVMGKKLYVGNLPYSATQDSLEKTFGAIGEVNSVNVIKDRDTGQSKGFAFVEMTRDGDADKAVHELDGTMIDDREIKVNEAKPKRR